MKKIITIVLAMVMVLSLCTLNAFAAEDYEVDLSTLSGAAANYSAHGYPDRTLVMFGYGTVVSLGTLDLSQYDSCEVTYATDLGYKALIDGMNATAMWALKSNSETIGYVNVGPNEDGLIAKGDCVDASIINEEGANWDKGERTTVIDLSNVDYNGEVFLSHFNSTGNEGLCVSIKFVAKEEQSAGGLRDFDADKDKQYFDAILVNGEIKANGNDEVAALKAMVDGSNGDISSLGLFGWFASGSPISQFGYIVDSNDPVFSDDFVTGYGSDEEKATIEGTLAGGRRYLVTVDLSSLQDGNDHVIKVVAKLENGDIVIFNRPNREAIVNYKAPKTETPPETQPATQPETQQPQTGDAAVAMFAVLAILAMGAVVVFAKKRSF